MKRKKKQILSYLPFLVIPKTQKEPLFKHLAFFFVACDAIFDNITHAILRIFQFNYNSKKNSVVKIFFSVIFLSEVVCIYLTI